MAIEELEAISGELGGVRGLRSLIEELRAEQERGNKRLAAALDRILDQRLAERLAELAKAARP